MTDTLYNGEVKLDFFDQHPQHGEHVYLVNDQVVPSATQVAKLLPKPWLVYWAVNQTIDYIDQYLRSHNYAVDEVSLPTMLKAAKSARFRSRDSAATAGSAAHTWLEDWVNADIAGTPYPGDPINEGVASVAAKFVEWTKTENVHFVFAERRIYSRQHDCAGTVDLGFRRGTSPVLHIADHKTGKGVGRVKKGRFELYGEIVLQQSFYQAALAEMGEPATGDRLVLHIPVQGGDLTPHYVQDDLGEVMEVFAGLRRLHGWLDGGGR